MISSVVKNQACLIGFELESTELNAQRSTVRAGLAITLNVQLAVKTRDKFSATRVDSIGVIDLFAHDSKTDEVLLVMNEPDSWDGSDERLHNLQERFNAYASFLLDGEMVEAHPELSGKSARIEVRCAHMPDASALELLGMIHDRLAFQDIKMEVVVRGESCGTDCGCG